VWAPFCHCISASWNIPGLWSSAEAARLALRQLKQMLQPQSRCFRQRMSFSVQFTLDNCAYKRSCVDEDKVTRLTSPSFAGEVNAESMCAGTADSWIQVIPPRCC
jgi:hypothetical protein